MQRCEAYLPKSLAKLKCPIRCDDEASEDEQLTSWTVPRTSSGSEFGDKIGAFESNNLGIFDVEKNAEYTFEMSRVH